MTLESDKSRAQYETNGTTGPWTVPFYFLDEEDLVVIYTAAGIDTVLTLDVDYTVSGAGVVTGGTVTTVVAYASPGLITIERDLSYLQETEYPESGPFPAKSHERALDREVMIAQQLRDLIVRSIQIPLSDAAAAPLPNAAVRVDRLLAFDANGMPIVSTFTATELASLVATAFDGGATTAAAITFLAGGIGAYAMSVQDKLRLDATYPEEWGAYGDGSSHPLSTRFATLIDAQVKYGSAAVDLSDEIDGVVIQSMIDNDVPIQLKAVTYLTSRGIRAKIGMDVVGRKPWSTVASTNPTFGVTTIRYVGAGGADSYVALLSTQAVGVEPTDPSTRDLQNVRFCNLVLDGNDLAWYPLIEIRAWAGNILDNLAITGGRVCGNVVLSSWVSGPQRRHVYKNRGAGVWLAKNIWSFTGFTVDQFTGQDWFIYFNGCDSTGTPYNTFADTGGTYPTSSNVDATCGLAVYGSRALKLANLQCQDNDGPGLVMIPQLKGPIHVDGGYFEFNSRSSGASRNWAIWTETRNDSWSITYEKIYFGADVSRPTACRITGVQSSREEQGPKFVDCPLLGTLVVDVGYQNWNLINCDSAVVIVGEPPQGPLDSRGGVRFDPAKRILRNYDYNSSSTGFTLQGATTAGTGWAYSANNQMAWTRVGRQVTVTGTMELTTKSGTAGGQLSIRGLPFTVNSGLGYAGAAQISRALNFTNAHVSLSGRFAPATTQIDLYVRAAAATSETGLLPADISNTTTFAFTGTYFTSDP